MKKLLLLFIVLANYSFSQTWSNVGQPNFAPPGADDIFSAVAPDGVPYVAFRDLNSFKATVKKFDGNNWITVGAAGFSAGDMNGPTIVFDNAGVPYVAYTDWQNGGKACVMKFDGTNWIAVGNIDFTDSAATFTSIALDSNNTPYVAFRDFFHNYRASVMKFDGTSWVYVGTPGFSAYGTGQAGAVYTSLAIDKHGTLYITYTEMSNNFNTTAMKFDGSNWVYVGNASGFSTGGANNPSIVIDSQGTPYVGFEDGANGAKATVKKFDGSNWVPVGIAGFSPGVAEYTSLAIDNNDVLYLIFNDHAHSNKATVMTFNGSSWVTVGTPGFSAAEADYTTIAIDKNNGILYAAYEDVYNPNTNVTYNATVMQFDISNTTGIKEIENSYSINVYPNPTSRIITIDISTTISKRKFTLKVSNSLGKVVYSEDLKEIPNSFTKQIDLSALAKGIYFVELQATSGSLHNTIKSKVTKLILQ